LINQIIFLTVFKNALASGSPPRTSLGGSYSAPPVPLAEISNLLFEIITEMLREKQFWTCNSKFPIALKNYLLL